MSGPYIVINMVSTLDGKTSLEGKASGIGTEADRSAMRTLRSKVDAVMIGAGTLRAEKLSLGLDASDSARSPLAVIVSGTGDVPLKNNLVRYANQDILVILPESAGEVHLGRDAEVLQTPATASGRVDLAKAMEVLKAERAVDRLLVEGGPTLIHALISSGLGDELFVTLAPTLFGTGDLEEPSMLGGPLAEPQALHLLSAYLADDELFLRYELPRIPVMRSSARN